MSVENCLGEQVHQFFLHEALDRTGAVCRFIALRAHIVLKLLCELKSDTILRKLLLKIGYLHSENITDIGLRQRLKHDHLVNSVEELRTHGPLQNLKNLIPALVKYSLTRRFGGFSQRVFVRLSPIRKNQV